MYNELVILYYVGELLFCPFELKIKKFTHQNKTTCIAHGAGRLPALFLRNLHF